MNLPQSDLPRIVVIGCGFAGIQFVKKINTKHYQVVLIDQNNYHTFQPLLYQVATSGLEPDSIAHPIRKTFRNKKRFHFRLAEVLSIDSKNKLVSTSIGDIHFTYCVIATGASSNFFGIDSIEKHSLPMKSLTEALDLRSKILQNFEEALKKNDLKEREKLMNIVIVGAGPTGVELSGAIAELKNKILPKDFPDLDLRNMQIHLIEAGSQVLAPMSNKSSKNAEKFLRNMGVNVWLDTIVESYDGNTVKTNKENFISDTVIWSAGVSGAPPKTDDISINKKSNRILVNEYGETIHQKNIYALGDVALFTAHNEGNGFPMLGSVAMQQGVFLAKNFNRLAVGKSSSKFEYKDKGTMATIGRNKAVADLSKMHFKGIAAWFIWMFVHLMLLVGFRNRVVVFINWSWNYFKYNNGHRLIVRPYEKNKQMSIGISFSSLYYLSRRSLRYGLISVFVLGLLNIYTWDKPQWFLYGFVFLFGGLIGFFHIMFAGKRLSGLPLPILFVVEFIIINFFTFDFLLLYFYFTDGPEIWSNWSGNKKYDYQ